MAQHRGRADARRPARPGREAGGPTTRPGGDLAGLRARLREIIDPVASAAGFDVEHLAVSRVGRRHVLRLTVDSDGGVDLDAVARLSRQVSIALDEVEAGTGELISGEYDLEVSSPGVDRPLTEPRHWRRNVGRLVKVKMGDSVVTGRVTGADDERVRLDVNGAARSVSYGELGPGRVEVEFGRPDDDPEPPEGEEDGE
jgi:ribosome maturation factor RimP